jgi:hypothetical protein
MAKSTPSIPRELPLRVNLPSFLLREIGRIVSRHAILEWKLSRTIYTLLGIDPVCGRVAVREPRTTDRLDMIADLIKIKNISVSADLPAIRNALDACVSQRDALAHGLWIVDPDYPNRLFLRQTAGNWTPPGKIGKHKRRIDPQAIEYVLEDAKGLAELIDATIQAVYDLEEEIKSALKASPTKSP